MSDDQRLEELLAENARLTEELSLLQSDTKQSDIAFLLDTMPIGWAEHQMIFDEEGRPQDYVFLRVNTAFEQFTGLERRTILGQRVTAIIPAIRDAEPDLISLYGEVTSSGKQRRFELYFEPFEHWYRVTAFRTREGHFAVVFENITERKLSEKRAIEEERKFSTFLDNTKDLVTSVDSRGRFLYTNGTSKEVFGLSPAATLGRLAFEFIHQDDLPATQEAFSSWIKDHVTHASWENRQVSITGEVRHMLWTIMPQYKDDELESVWSIARDITDRKQTEEELRRLNQRLAQSNSELEQFAYVASHDLQEPMRMVASYTQLLAKRYEGKLDGDAEEFIGYAVDGAKRMKILINDLLEFSRVSTRVEALSLTDCSEVVREVINDLSQAVLESNAEIRVGELPKVMADDSQLRQVFQNLIANSIKFRSEVAPQVEISARREGSDWEFSVADNGLGIEPQFHEQIFVIFQRLHGRGTYPGTGIGLATVKKIVERHGGQIRVESSREQGARFVFTLPAAEDDE